MTVFLNLVAESMPVTSDAVPLIGRPEAGSAANRLEAVPTILHVFFSVVLCLRFPN